jgi:hypothetical protein
MESEELDLNEEDRSLFLALCAPLARMAVRRGIPLRAVKHLVGMACYHETRLAGLTGPEATEVMDVSLRTITQLSRQMKDFLTVESQHGLPRKLEHLLWAEPISAARMKQTIRGYTAEEIGEALDLLLAEGRIRLRDDLRYEVTSKQVGLVDMNSFGARVDGMKDQLEAVADSVQARFIEGLPEEQAMARTYTVRIMPSQQELMFKALYPTFKFALEGMEQAARGQEDLIEMAMSITWAPRRMVDRTE